MSEKIIQRTVSDGELMDDNLHPVLERVFLARNISHTNELDYSLKHLLPFSDLLNIQQAVELLTQAIQKQQRLLVVADFDADGATSCALAIKALTAMGAKNVEYIVPNRFEYGYGLTPEIVELAADLEPDLIITVDNGISSIDGVAKARALEIDVLVTDHHLAGPELPNANVIVNPNQPGDEFASKNLAGVGVMFNVVVALRSHLRELNWFGENNIKEPNLAEYLDLVALGTVADVVPLDRNNRILVSQGLARIRKGYCCEGIKALVKVSNRSLHKLKASDFGFAIGPRLNAAGRLTDMSVGIECLLSDDPSRAESLATQLDQLNQERRKIQDEMHIQALDNLDVEALESKDNFGLCLFHEEWHQGVVGILASKIKERFHRPVIAFAREDENTLKGSARSISGIHIRDVLEAIDTQHPGVISKFGGHAMAAGLTIENHNFDQFTGLFTQQLARIIEPGQLDNIVYSDGELVEKDFSLQLAQLIERAGPWGQGFPEPIFDGIFSIIKKRIVGGNHLKLDLQPQNTTQVIDAIAFNLTDEDWPDDIDSIHVAYRLDINEFNGRTKLQLFVEYLEPLINRPENAM